MQCHAADSGSLAAFTAPSSPARHDLASGDHDGCGGSSGHYFFFSAPASPVHYILRSPPSSTAASTTAAAADGDFCCGGGAVGDFEFAARDHGAGDGGGDAAMSSAEELFVAGRIRVGCLSPIRQETGHGEKGEEYYDAADGGGGGEEEGGHGTPRHRRARSASPPRSPRLAKTAQPSEASFASASSSSFSSSSSSSAKTTRGRRISLRDLLTGTGCSGDDSAAEASSERSGFWPTSIWPSSRSKKGLLPCPAPQPGRRSTSSDRPATAARGEFPRRRTTSLPYRQGLVLGCLGFGARSYGLAKSMHPLSSR